MKAESMISMIDEVISYVKGQLVDISDYELTMIRNVLNKIHQSIPSTKLLLTEDINSILQVKSDLIYIMFKLRDLRLKTKIAHDKEYNKLFTQLTRMGRPSKAAIDSEIYHNNSNLQDMSISITNNESIYEFLNEQKSILDKVVQTMEARRYDLN